MRVCVIATWCSLNFEVWYDIATFWAMHKQATDVTVLPCCTAATAMKFTVYHVSGSIWLLSCCLLCWCWMKHLGHTRNQPVRAKNKRKQKVKYVKPRRSTPKVQQSNIKGRSFSYHWRHDFVTRCSSLLMGVKQSKVTGCPCKDWLILDLDTQQRWVVSLRLW